MSLIPSFLEAILSQLSQIASMSNFTEFIKSYQNSNRTQSLLYLSRGTLLVSPLPSACVSFFSQLLSLLPSLFSQLSLHEDFQILALKLLRDLSQAVSTFLRFYVLDLFASRVGIASLCGNAPFHRRAFRSDAPQRSETPPQVVSPFPLLNRASSFISKALGLCFDAETQFLASGVLVSSSIAASISQLHLALLQCVSRDLSFFPLFMKRVMQSSIAVLSHCVAGLDLQADSLLESLFSFLIAAYDIFESKIRDYF